MRQVSTWYYGSIQTDSSVQFFPGATPYFRGFGTSFVKNMIWYIRDWLTGDSYIATLFFFSIFAFLGGVLWYLLFVKIGRRFNINVGQFTLPALIIMCWPSFLFFTSGMGKDSLSYFFIPLAFLAYMKISENRGIDIINYLILFVSLLFLFLLRPYLLMVFTFTYLISQYFTLKALRVDRLFYMAVGGLVFLYVVHWVLIKEIGFHNISLGSIAQRATLQQNELAKGTSFYMPNINPVFRLLLLPYSFVMNLLFPLFYLARSMTGYIVSLENGILLYICCSLFKYKKIIKHFFLRSPITKLLFYFFVTGMSFLALINTNLGLSTRQKSMYVPPLLILYCLIYCCKKYALSKRSTNKYENRNHRQLRTLNS